MSWQSTYTFIHGETQTDIRTHTRRDTGRHIYVLIQTGRHTMYICGEIQTGRYTSFTQIQTRTCRDTDRQTYTHGQRATCINTYLTKAVAFGSAGDIEAIHCH